MHGASPRATRWAEQGLDDAWEVALRMSSVVTAGDGRLTPDSLVGQVSCQVPGPYSEQKTHQFLDRFPYRHPERSAVPDRLTDTGSPSDSNKPGWTTRPAMTDVLRRLEIGRQHA